MEIKDINPKLLIEIQDALGGESVEKWLVSPVASLEGKTPLEVLSMPNGEDYIRGVLEAIKHGLYS